MACHVLIRETLDWEHATYDDLKNSFMREVARQWDSVFHVTYIECRARIKSVTCMSLKALPEVHIHVPGSFDVSLLHPEDFLLICDDDDWYHPRLVDHLLEHEQSRGRLKEQFVVWPDGVYGCTKVKRLPGQVRERALDDGVSMIKTNNYAVTGRFLCSEPNLLPNIQAHGNAVRYFKSTNVNVLKLSKALSLVNRHPCSQLVLHNNLRSMEVAEYESVLRTLIQQYVQGDHSTLQPSFRWAGAYISRAKAVFQDALGM